MEIKPPKSVQPMPAHAKRVFKGQIFDVYQWEQKLYDGSTAIFEKLKRPNTAFIIPVLPDGKILIAHQEQPDKKPFLGVLGGRVEEGEEPLAAAKRELQEESGYESAEWLLFDAVQPTPKIDWIIYTFIARKCEKKKEQALDAGEKIDLKTVSFEDFLDLMTSSGANDVTLSIPFFKAKLDPERMSELKKLILGSI